MKVARHNFQWRVPWDEERVPYGHLKDKGDFSNHSTLVSG